MLNDNERAMSDMARLQTHLNNILRLVETHGEKLSAESMLKLSDLTTQVEVFAARLSAAARRRLIEIAADEEDGA